MEKGSDQEHDRDPQHLKDAEMQDADAVNSQPTTSPHPDGGRVNKLFSAAKSTSFNDDMHHSSNSESEGNKESLDKSNSAPVGMSLEQRRSPAQAEAKGKYTSNDMDSDNAQNKNGNKLFASRTLIDINLNQRLL